MVWFLNKQYEDKNPILGRWLGVSHRVVSTLYHWILNEIGNVISCATVQNLPGDKPRDSTIQEQICDYYGFLESALRNDNSGNSLERDMMHLSTLLRNLLQKVIQKMRTAKAHGILHN